MKNRILNYLEEKYPNARCELNYQKNYELLIAVVLSAQTTDKAVNKVTKQLFSKYKSLKELSVASLDDIKSILRPLGNFNKKSLYVSKISKILLEEGLKLDDRTFLEKLPGVGRKTANVVLSNLYGESVIAVDTHVSRVSKRLGLAKIDDNPYLVEKKLTKFFDKKDLCKLHHQLIFFGRYHCKSRNPKCKECKLKDICKYEKKNL